MSWRPSKEGREVLTCLRKREGSLLCEHLEKQEKRIGMPRHRIGAVWSDGK